MAADVPGFLHPQPKMAWTLGEVHDIFLNLSVKAA